MKKVLITGANSYIGDSVREYLINSSSDYVVDIKDTLNWNPQKSDFEGYDVVFNVAGIVHVKESKKNSQLYYRVNRDLVVRIAKAAKEAGVHQFILLSTMSVYGMLVGKITKQTRPNPTNSYGKSKLQADEIIRKLESDSFKFVCIRPPMVYGKECKGNYQILRSFALKSPLFPYYKNQRSMIYIGNLCEFIKQVIDKEKRGLFFPQNAKYVNTSKMVMLIAKVNKKKMSFTKFFNMFLNVAPMSVIKKVFGNLVYEKVDTIDKYSFEESIALTEAL